MTTPTPPTTEERRRLQEIAFNLAGNAAELGFDATVEFTRSQSAEKYATCGHCGRDTELPPAEPTQCPATGWDTHPESRPDTAQDFLNGVSHFFSEKERLLLMREVEKLQANNAMLRTEKAALEHGHAEAEKQIALLESRLEDRLKQIAGLERNNRELRDDRTNAVIRAEAVKDHEISHFKNLLNRHLERIFCLEKELEQANAARPVDHSQAPAAGVDQILSLRGRITELTEMVKFRDYRIEAYEREVKRIGQLAVADFEKYNQQIKDLNTLLASERHNAKCRESAYQDITRENETYKQRHLEISQAFYDETDGPAVKDNHADWIRQSKRLRITFNKMVLLATPVPEEEIANNPAKFPRLR